MSLSVPMNDPNGRQYSRDSFDRFGDDLSELILSFLPFKHKFGFECVSKQWRRLVFNKVIHFDDLSNFKHLKTILKKCDNIQTIKLYMNSKTVSFLSLLSDNCHRLKSIELLVTEEVSSEEMTSFGETLGSKVEAIDTRLMSHNIEMLNWFPNLKRLKFERREDWLSLVGNQLVPKLNQLSSVGIRSYQMSAFVKLVDKYKNTMKNIAFNFDTDCNINPVFQQLYRFNNLESLNLLLPTTDQEFDLSPKIIALNQYCSKLSKIHLQTLDEVSLSHSLKPITSIKNLSFGFREIPDNFFTNLSLLTPNIQELKFSAYEHIYTNKDLTDLSRIKHLKRLLLSASKSGHSTDDSAVIQLLDNCKELQELGLYFWSNITVETISALKELANIRHKEKIRFSTVISGNESPELRRSLTEIPNNLIFYMM